MQYNKKEEENKKVEEIALSALRGRTSFRATRRSSMSTVNMVKTIKKIYPLCIVLVKIGNFYHVFGKDSYILSYLFEYKIVEKSGIPTCGFPINAISKMK